MIYAELWMAEWVVEVTVTKVGAQMTRLLDLEYEM